MIKWTRGIGSLERWLLVIGVVLLSIYGAAHLYRLVGSKLALGEFDQAHAVARSEVAKKLPRSEPIDFSLWSDKRIRAYRDSFAVHTGVPLAVVRIERLNIRVPVFDGTNDLALNRGAGWIAGTAKLGEAGNAGIAGHRDGCFRALKDILPEDEIELTTVEEARIYTVDTIEIVEPNNVSVLAPRNVPSLTLVTCYPFYFVGDAPRRFIVHAALKERTASLGSNHVGVKE